MYITIRIYNLDEMRVEQTNTFEEAFAHGMDTFKSMLCQYECVSDDEWMDIIDEVVETGMYHFSEDDITTYIAYKEASRYFEIRYENNAEYDSPINFSYTVYNMDEIPVV